MSPIRAGELTAPNRFVHQPMECNDCVSDPDDESTAGFPSEATLNRYKRLAEGGAGITVVEAASVGSTSRARKHQLIADADHRKGIEALAASFKKCNQNSILCFQLSHSGHLSHPGFSEVVRVTPPSRWDPAPGRVLATNEIDRIVGDFIRAAEIVHYSGADMVDIKLCHGYLGGQLIRPANTRSDKYGGSLENRMRFARDIIRGVTETVPELGIMTRISLYEGDKTGEGVPIVGGTGTKGPDSSEKDLSEPLEMARMLAEYGADVINVSAGIPIYNGEEWVRPTKPPQGFVAENPGTYGKYHHFAHSRMVKDLGLGVPVIASGLSVFGENIARVAENVIANGWADMAGIGRQTLADANVGRILAGEADYCRRCGGCSELLAAQKEVVCVAYGS